MTTGRQSRFFANTPPAPANAGVTVSAACGLGEAPPVATTGGNPAPPALSPVGVGASGGSQARKRFRFGDQGKAGGAGSAGAAAGNSAARSGGLSAWLSAGKAGKVEIDLEDTPPRTPAPSLQKPKETEISPPKAPLECRPPPALGLATGVATSSSPAVTNLEPLQHKPVAKVEVALKTGRLGAQEEDKAEQRSMPASFPTATSIPARPMTPSVQPHLAGSPPPACPPPAVATTVTVGQSELPTRASATAESSPPVAKAESPAKSSSVGAPTRAAEKPGLPLAGVTMVFTGELDQLTRQDAEEKVKVAGGKVMSGVSGNTTYLVLGSHLEDGRKVEETSKYKKYLELKSKGKKWPELLDESQLLTMLPGAQAPTPRPPLNNQCSAMATSSLAAGSTSSAPADRANWVDAHAPRGFAELIGNASVVRKLSEWLRDWENVVLKGQTKKPAFKPGGGMPENINARAALVSGPPGIGKTTTARLVAQVHGGYEVLEYNASDARGRKIIQEMADGIADNHTISFGRLAQAKAQKLTRKACIIMDEVDGMGAGDLGGSAALIKMIKKTKNPIICICNDQHSQKVRSLAFSCYDLKFQRPTKNNIAERCAQIAKQEGLEVEPNALEALAESCGGDMRMVLNQLQMLARSPMYQAAGVTYTDMKKNLDDLAKDQAVMITPFDACKKLLNASQGARMSFRDRMDMFFVDYGLVGMLVQENYLRAVESRKLDIELMNRCAFSADLLTISDLMNRRIREDQDWGLLPDMGVTGAVFPASVTNGFINFPTFPAWLGKYSHMTKMQRLTTELHAHLRVTASVKGHSIITSGYGDLLYKRVMDPLMKGDSDAVTESFAVLDAYGLRREHLTEHLTELRQHVGGEDLFKGLDPRVKSAMTRESNNGVHAVKVMVPSGGKKRKATAEEHINPDELDEETAEELEARAESEDDTLGSALIKVKGKPKAKAKGKAKAAKVAGAKDDGDIAGTPTPKSKGRGNARITKARTFS